MPEISPSHRRTAFALSHNVQALCDRFGIDRIGFLTLTFADHVLDAREAQRRFNSFAVNFLSVQFPDGYIRVLERMKSGRIHYHLLVVCPCDIRSGFDFAGIARRDYSSASPGIRSLWVSVGRAAKLHRFGRTELLPIHSTTDAIAKYVGKYIAKHVDQREERDKGVRFAAYSRGARAATTKFAWTSSGAKEWRRKIAIFVGLTFERGLIAWPDFDAMREVYGPKWCYRFREQILAMP